MIEKYDSDTVLPELIGILASDCKFRGRLVNQGCGAVYPVLGSAQKRNPPLEFR